MKGRLVIAALLLMAVLGVGWNDHRQLDRLREAHGRLVDEAEEKGISFDPQVPSQASLPSKLPRVDRVAEAKQLSAEFIAYAEEMKGLAEIESFRMAGDDGSSAFALNEEVRRRIIAQVDRVGSLDAGQLRILVEEFHEKSAGSENYRHLVGFALDRLMRDHPREMLAALTEVPGLFETLESKGGHAQLLAGEAVYRLSKQDLAGARRWLDEHRAILSAGAIDTAMRRIIGGAAVDDFRLALVMMEDSGMVSPHFVQSLASHAGADQRQRALPLLREWCAARTDVSEDEMISTELLETLAFGPQDITALEQRDFQESSTWIDQAGLSNAELESLTENIQNRIRPEEFGPWIEWLGRSLPDALAQRRIEATFHQWVEMDYKTAGTWLESAECGPVRNSMVERYVERTFPLDRERAIRVALILPEGGKRDHVLKQLYLKWPKGGKASREAAEAFADEHGIQR